MCVRVCECVRLVWCVLVRPLPMPLLLLAGGLARVGAASVYGPTAVHVIWGQWRCVRALFGRTWRCVRTPWHASARTHKHVGAQTCTQVQAGGVRACAE